MADDGCTLSCLASFESWLNLQWSEECRRTQICIFLSVFCIMYLQMSLNLKNICLDCFEIGQEWSGAPQWFHLPPVMVKVLPLPVWPRNHFAGCPAGVLHPWKESSEKKLGMGPYAKIVPLIPSITLEKQQQTGPQHRRTVMFGEKCAKEMTSSMTGLATRLKTSSCGMCFFQTSATP